MITHIPVRSVEQKINELGDRNQDNVPHNLRDALRLYVENCKESTNPLTWYKTPDPEDDSAESLQQEEVADAERVSSSEPVFDGTEHSPLLDDLRQVLKSHFGEKCLPFTWFAAYKDVLIKCADRL